MYNEHPVDFRDRREVESCLTFAISCVLTIGIAFNLLLVALVAYAN